MPVRSSTVGYCQEILSSHCRHLPPKTRYENTGILSYQAICFRQLRQTERPISVSPSAMRQITTFKKLPMRSPNMKKRIVCSIALLYLVLFRNNKKPPLSRRFFCIPYEDLLASCTKECGTGIGNSRITYDARIHRRCSDRKRAASGRSAALTCNRSVVRGGRVRRKNDVC